MLFADLIKNFEERANSQVLNNKNMLFVGARVTWEDDLGVKHFGVVYDYDDSALTCDIIDDNDRPHSDIDISMIKRYGGMKTEKLTGKLKKYSSAQEDNLADRNTKLTAMKFFTAKQAVVWDRVLMKCAYLFVNEAFFKGKMVFQNSIVPELETSTSLAYYGAFYHRTMKIVVNRNYLQTFQMVTSVTAHEMIHLFDYKFRKNGRMRDTLSSPNGVYDPHGEWFQNKAKSIEAALGMPNTITFITDNLDEAYKAKIAEFEDEEYDPKSRSGYNIEVDKDDTIEKTKKFYVVVYYQGLGKPEGEKPLNYVFALKCATYDKADIMADHVNVESRGVGRYDRNFVDIYETDLQYFDKFLDTPTTTKQEGLLKTRKKIGLKMIRLIIKHGESKKDGQEGGMLQYFLERIAKLPVEDPSE
jgi:hypothetical protein